MLRPHIIIYKPRNTRDALLKRYLKKLYDFLFDSNIDIDVYGGEYGKIIPKAKLRTFFTTSSNIHREKYGAKIVWFIAHGDMNYGMFKYKDKNPSNPKSEDMYVNAYEILDDVNKFADELNANETTLVIILFFCYSSYIV